MRENQSAARYEAKLHRQRSKVSRRLGANIQMKKNLYLPPHCISRRMQSSSSVYEAYAKTTLCGDSDGADEYASRIRSPVYRDCWVVASRVLYMLCMYRGKFISFASGAHTLGLDDGVTCARLNAAILFAFPTFNPAASSQTNIIRIKNPHRFKEKIKDFNKH